MGFPRQEYWSGLPFPSPGDLPDPGMEPRSPALQADSSLVAQIVKNLLVMQILHYLSHQGSPEIPTCLELLLLSRFSRVRLCATP